MNGRNAPVDHVERLNMKRFKNCKDEMANCFSDSNSFTQVTKISYLYLWSSSLAPKKARSCDCPLYASQDQTRCREVEMKSWCPIFKVCDKIGMKVQTVTTSRRCKNGTEANQPKSYTIAALITWGLVSQLRLVITRGCAEKKAQNQDMKAMPLRYFTTDRTRTKVHLELARQL